MPHDLSKQVLYETLPSTFSTPLSTLLRWPSPYGASSLLHFPSYSPCFCPPVQPLSKANLHLSSQCLPNRENFTTRHATGAGTNGDMGHPRERFTTFIRSHLHPIHPPGLVPLHRINTLVRAPHDPHHAKHTIGAPHLTRPRPCDSCRSCSRTAVRYCWHTMQWHRDPSSGGDVESGP